ncbi:MAG: hypothetical protein K2G12_10335 [Prevotella sp.]|nr:hypothetical protein [Prevotella sp.]
MNYTWQPVAINESLYSKVMVTTRGRATSVLHFGHIPTLFSRYKENRHFTLKVATGTTVAVATLTYTMPYSPCFISEAGMVRKSNCSGNIDEQLQGKWKRQKISKS